MSEDTTTTQDPSQDISQFTTGTTRAPEESEISNPLLNALLSRLGSQGVQTIQQSGLLIHDVLVLQVTVAELRAAIATNPSHAVAEVYDNATRALAPTDVVAIETVDLQALLTNSDVHYSDRQTSDGTVRTKFLVPKI